MRAWVRCHRWVCGLFAAVLLFGQLATAAYACPKGAAAPGHERGAAMVQAAVPGCAGHRPADVDADQRLLCKAHCQADEQSVNNAQGAADVPPAALLGGILLRVLDVADDGQAAAERPGAQSVGPPAGSPPLYLALLVLRN